ncbi:MAG: chemotaxis protein CheA [Proteobacteria bacterium]|nr:chemotaxis protein CheA [Pseudomonadota bacterium]
MSIDMSQFHQTYLEEAVENLAELENGLLALERDGNADLNAIFRAAHSIKGGAATFGFQDIADFTHGVETVLDKGRDLTLDLSAEVTAVLLRAVDVLGELITAARENRKATANDRLACQQALTDICGDGTPKAASARKEGTGGHKMMNITFKPHPDLPKTGSDPLNILRELGRLGEMTLTAFPESVPTLEELEVENLFLWWEATLETEHTVDDVHDVFLFVTDEAEITVQVVAAIDAAPQAQPVEQTLVAEPMTDRRAPENERRAGNDRRQPEKAPETAFIRVATDKVDNLINLVGELVTTHAMVSQHSSRVDADGHPMLHSSVQEMAHHTRTLQEAIMAIRMMPISFAFSRFPRMVRDTATKLGKQVSLVTHGDQTELDKTVIERIADPLTHLVRNAIDHGIEIPEERKAHGKPAEATVELAAYYRGGNVMIEVRDDGRGLDRDKLMKKATEKGLAQEGETYTDEQVYQFIFHPGFSTAAQVTDVSGRGVGMDIVRKNIQSLGGNISIETEKHKGTRFIISLPLTLAIVDGMAIRSGDEVYIVPILNIMESIKPTKGQVKTVGHNAEVMDIRGSYIPFVRLSEVFKTEMGDGSTRPEDGIAMIVESDHERIALFVDELLGERQVVIKSIEANYRAIEGVSGATILGDGRVSFIIDLAGIIKRANREGLHHAPVKPNKSKMTEEGHHVV